MIKLNLGCAYDYRPGWINVDKTFHYKTDIYHDLNVKPYPFKDDSVDLVLLRNVLEHIDSLLCLEEVYRICKPNARVIIEVPFSINGFCHIQHTKQFNWDTFKGLKSPYLNFKFKLIKQYPYNRQKKGIGILRKYIPFKKALSFFFPVLVQNIHAELRCIKN